MRPIGGPRASSLRSQGPEEAEIEVSLFGPGYGESVVLHLGFGDWIIVDSCVDPLGKPQALSYLDLIGVDYRSDVKLVVATHWHDDHIRGISQILAECEKSTFATSAALHNLEFLNLVTALEPGLMASTSGLTEFSRVLEILAVKSQQGGEQSPYPNWSKSFVPIWEQNGEGKSASVQALSPSDAEMVRAWKDIATLLPETGSKRRLAAPAQNHASVALWVTAGAHAILLGADLEETGKNYEGWATVVSSSLRPRGRASVIKVPHHGSANGHNEALWDDMLQDPVAILTPFRRSRVPLPTPKDVERLCRLTAASYATAPPKGVAKSPRRPRIVEQAIREAVVSIAPTEAPAGQIRLRVPFQAGEADWAVELFGAAIELCRDSLPDQVHAPSLR